GSTMYASLLDDINKQFLTHVDQGVLAEASIAILHARSFDDLQEVTDSKLQELWSDTIDSLRTLIDAKESDEDFDLTGLCNTVSRIANLASVADCVNVFESEARSKSKNTAEAMTASPAHLLTGLINSAPDESYGGQSEERGQLTIDCIKALLLYNMWLVRSLQTSLTSSTPPPRHLPDTSAFASGLLTVMNTRSGLDPVRIAAANASLDLYTLYASFRHLSPQQHPSSKSPTNNLTTPPNNKGKAAAHRPTNLDSLVQTIPPDSQTCILAIFASAEKHHARLSHRGLEPAPDDAVDDAPEDPESDREDDDEDDAGNNEPAQTRKLLAEKQLCELAGKMVLAVVGRVFPAGAEGEAKVRARLKRNEKRLGANFREVVAYLEDKKKKRQGREKEKEKARSGGISTAASAGADRGKGKEDGGRRRTTGGGGGSRKGGMKSAEMVVDVGSGESEEEESGGGEEEEELEEGNSGGELADDRIEDFDETGGKVLQQQQQQQKEVELEVEVEEDEIMGD
ncbi:MAG: hypothetical protein Q9177_006061, partial [Variospora cf. flavescens]